MSEPIPANDLSPLDQIRLVEAEVARRIVAARASSDERVGNARAQAASLRKQAKETGEREGQLRYKEIIAQAEVQAKVIVAQAQQDAEELRRKGRSRMERAIGEALNIVLGTKGAQGIDES